MMINCVVLMGRLTADPELKTTTTGLSVVRFSLAVERDYLTDGGRPTDFITCVAWRQRAEFLSKYFRKGQMVAVQGSIQNRHYLDKNDNRRTITEVVCEKISFCGSKGDNVHPAAGASATPGNGDDGSFSNSTPEDFLDVCTIEDDLPF